MTQTLAAEVMSLSVKKPPRATETVLRIVFKFFGCEQRVPNWTTIRCWMQRAGVAALGEPVEEGKDWIWMADHSNQIGTEKALVVLAVRASKLPPPGEPLTHAHVRVLAVEPGVNWKTEDMARVYTGLAERFSAPRAIRPRSPATAADGSPPSPLPTPTAPGRKCSPPPSIRTARSGSP